MAFGVNDMVNFKFSIKGSFISEYFEYLSQAIVVQFFILAILKTSHFRKTVRFYEIENFSDSSLHHIFESENLRVFFST